VESIGARSGRAIVSAVREAENEEVTEKATTLLKTDFRHSDPPVKSAGFTRMLYRLRYKSKIGEPSTENPSQIK